MTIRFLQSLAPYSAGQIIDVEQPSAWLLGLLDGVRAEVVKESAALPEIAVVPVPDEVAIARAPRRRGRLAAS